MGTQGKGSRKKVIFLVTRPLRERGGVKARLLRKITFFEARKQIQKNEATKLGGGGERPAGPLRK